VNTALHARPDRSFCADRETDRSGGGGPSPKPKWMTVHGLTFKRDADEAAAITCFLPPACPPRTHRPLVPAGVRRLIAKLRREPFTSMQPAANLLRKAIQSLRI
jgi:hypothetical protein